MDRTAAVKPYGYPKAVQRMGLPWVTGSPPRPIGQPLGLPATLRTTGRLRRPLAALR